MSHEKIENLTTQVQMDEINAAMMRYVIWANGGNIVRKGYLSEQELETAGQIMLIAAEVDQHFQKQGSLDGLKVHIGSCSTRANQAFYISNSLIRDLIDPKEMEGVNVLACSRWLSNFEGLEIIREERADKFGYFLADKEANWVETG